MNTQWDARCSQCKKALPAGTDVHYASRRVTCWECIDNPKPTADAIIKAQRLGFLPHDVALRWSWTAEYTTDAGETNGRDHHTCIDR